MTWLTWRQHRAQFYAGAALLAALAVLLLITGLQMASQWHSALAACTAAHTCTNQGGLFLGNRAVGFLVIMTLGTPVLAGLFWGAPLVAAELEAGTSPFAWMQSITRKRWLTVTTGWMLLAAAVWGGAISALVTWWSGPDNALHLDAFNPGRFDIMGIVPVAYALFAMALGITAGALLRRTLPAMAVTLAGFIAVRAVIALWLRPHYMSAITTTYNVLHGYTPPGSYWPLAQGILGPTGQPISTDTVRARDRGHPAQLPPGLMRAERGRQSHRAVLRAGPGPLPRVRHLPARRPLLGLPGHRGRHLPPPRRHPAHRDRGRAAPPRRLAHRATRARAAQHSNEPGEIPALSGRQAVSSQRRTLSPAELAEDRVITRCITRPMTAPGATIRVMPGDLERLPVPVSQPDPRRRLRASCQPARGGVTGFLRWLGWPSMPGARWE